MHKHFPHHNKSLVPIARTLRRNMTAAERKLWNVLRNNQAGVKFRRQFPYDEYVLDYYSHPIKLNVELDGSQHYTDEGIRMDNERDNKLRRNGIEVLRFTNDDVLRNIDGVGEAISQKIQERLETPPSSSPKRGGNFNTRRKLPSPLRRGLASPPSFWRG